MNRLNTLFVITIIALGVMSCEEQNEIEPFSIFNPTDETILVIEKSSGIETLVEPNERFPLKEGGSIVSNYTLELPSNQEKFVFFEVNSNGDFVFAIYDFYLQYKITGSNGAERASLTWATSTDGTGQTTVDLPYEIEYDEAFENKFYYISAQIENGYGFIRVEIINRFGNVISFDEANGEYAIATASNED